jgi:hypothetical protein
MSSVEAGKRVLVYGGSGALGNALVNFFKLKNYVSFNYFKIFNLFAFEVI